MTILAKAAFIRAQTRLRAVPHAPEIKLHLADEAVPLWLKTEEELKTLGLPPPFWAFAWAGGQALARYVLDHPETVAGKRVLDFASGSGLVAIAAAMAGAASVEAHDIDPFAQAAIDANAAANGVSVLVRVADSLGRDEGWNVVLAGDVSYERDMARATADWLCALHARGTLALLGDPGRAYLDRARFVPIAEYQVPVSRDLEDSAIKRARVWRCRQACDDRGEISLAPAGML